MECRVRFGENVGGTTNNSFVIVDPQCSFCARHDRKICHEVELASFLGEEAIDLFVSHCEISVGRRQCILADGSEDCGTVRKNGLDDRIVPFEDVVNRLKLWRKLRAHRRMTPRSSSAKLASSKSTRRSCGCFVFTMVQRGPGWSTNIPSPDSPRTSTRPAAPTTFRPLG